MVKGRLQNCPTRPWGAQHCPRCRNACRADFLLAFADWLFDSGQHLLLNLYCPPIAAGDVQTITSEERVEEEVTASISQYMEPDGFGLVSCLAFAQVALQAPQPGVSKFLPACDSSPQVLFLFSLVLTRGLDNIRDDMDVPDNALMGAHGYCTQVSSYPALTTNHICDPSEAFPEVKRLPDLNTCRSW